MEAAFAIICVGSVVCNILLLWIVIKLYTEILKGMHIDARMKHSEKETKP